MRLDDIDWALLDELQRDGRAGLRELGRRVGLSAPAVTARVRRLEAAGIITGYRAVVDPRALGLPVLAFVRVSGAGGVEADAEFMATARAIPEIREVHRVTGAETYLLRVQVKTVQDLERVLRPLWRYGDTVTGVVMSVPVADRPLTREMVG
ncbi:MAG TPA: Lrp/AsnC family transcriptional regulator [Acidimicrobiia bacterium]|nr:Lrp/AsnC family transcriptional regulator [Acidimicrobiia bacterium]